MNKDNLIKKVSGQTGIKKKKCRAILDRVFELVSNDLSFRKEVEIDHLGSFKFKRQPMLVMLKSTKRKTVFPPKEIIEFEMCEDLKRQINSDE